MSPKAKKKNKGKGKSKKVVKFSNLQIKILILYFNQKDSVCLTYYIACMSEVNLVMKC